jgi:hypothetical protein
MKKMPKQHLILLAFVVLALVGVSLAYAWGIFRQPLIQYSIDDPTYNKEYWYQEIGRYGPEGAYKAFLEKLDGESYTRTHFSAHAMGQALFKSQGVSGIRFCDGSFDFGCYHGFSLRAIAQGGKDTLIQLDQACTQSFGSLSGCKHGLGHGVLEYVGRNNINHALEMCKAFVYQPAKLLGCTSGVFMEYLTPLLVVEPVSRNFDPQNPYTPCIEVDQDFRPSCYFELGQWFRRTEGVNYGTLCGALEKDYAKYCFLGIGVDLTRGWKDTETLLEKCGRYTAENQLSCRAGAAWALIYDGSSSTVCEYGDVALTERCKKLADLTEGLDPSIEESLR